jgi:hypothetical protein
MRWHFTKDGDKPKPIKNETIPCVVDRYGYELCFWDTYNNCWNDYEDDDYAYDFGGVKRWAYIEDEKYEKETDNVCDIAMEEFKQTHIPAICKNCSKKIYPGESIIILDINNRIRSLFCNNNCLNAFMRLNHISFKNYCGFEQCISVKDMDYISCFGKIRM